MAKKVKENAEQNTEQNAAPEEINIVKEIVSMVLYIAFVILAVWLIITYVGQRTEVSGDSMNNTLLDGDNLWVDKLSYHFHDPERYDIVVFPHVEGDEESYYIKRIIGMPGEKIRIEENGTILINDKPLEENYGKEVIMPGMIGRADSDILLGEDEYFVMGDNRNDSKDSRFEEVGNIKRDELEGKAVLRMWPFSEFGKLK